MYWSTHIEGGPRRVNHTAVAIGDFIYSFGGYCSHENYSDITTIDIHVLNTNTLRWSKLTPQLNEYFEQLLYPDAPFQRYGHTSVAYEDKVYVWGGRNDILGCNFVFEFDAKTHKWRRPTTFGDIPGIRDGHSACVHGHYMYIFGGFEEVPNRFSSDVFQLNLKTMHWKYIKTEGVAPIYRDFHTATVIRNRMYIFGGRSDRRAPLHTENEVYCSQIFYLDLTTFVWHTPNAIGAIPIGRRSHSAFAYKDQLFIFGGFNGNLDRHFNDVYCYNVDRNQWNLVKTHGTGPKPRRRQVCLVVGSRLFLFGGSSPSEDESICIDTDELKLIDFSDTYVLEFEPNLKQMCLAWVIRNNIDRSTLPQALQWELRMMTTANNISRPLNNTG